MLVDDQDIVRRGFKEALEEYAQIDIVAESKDGAEAMTLAGRYLPEIIILDTDVQPSDYDELIRGLIGKAHDNAAKIVVLTSSADDEHLFRALQAGVSGFLLKSISQTELISAVCSIAQGYAVICPPMTKRLLERFDILPPLGDRRHTEALVALSRRETEVLVNVGEGKSNQEIARELHLTQATVKSHVSSVLAKLGLQNRVQAALLAYRVGLTRSR